MKNRITRSILAAFCAAAMMFTMAACGGSSSSSTTTTTDSDSDSSAAATTTADGDEQTFNLVLSHGLAEDHAIHIQLTSFAEDVAEQSGGTINITIKANGTLGSESDNIASIQAGALEMAKVSASTLSNFNSTWDVASLPYLFESEEHYFEVMDGEIGETLMGLTESDGFIGLTWFDSGARSFYTADTPIYSPDDLKGLKIRTMDSTIATNMMAALGGSSTVMSYSEVYTAMQNGTIDGAENNITAMRDHSDVTQYYCYDEHTRIPDILVISTSTWNSMSENQQNILKSCAQAATEEYKTAWDEFEEECEADAIANGVTFIESDEMDIEAFREACQSLYDDLDTEVADLVAQIQALA
ncbi:MAG: TRAP transporter substrate-binding protein [Clostridiales bacterium]|nr:TRAP transporter substrate-binding protein [Clostridiales bacterium]